MDYRDVIKEIGRGKAGARDLPYAPAHALFGAMLDGEVPELELGAIVLAYRIKGETTVELKAFLDAIDARLNKVSVAAPAIVIPTYNGARHSPNLVPLLALALRDAGFKVLVHGVAADPKRIATADIFAALEIPSCRDANDATRRLARDGLAFITIERIAPGLARLLDLRWRLGVRGSGHTACKMIQPFSGAALQLVSVTHPEYLAAMREYFTTHPAQVLLMRGTEGEAVANAKRPQAIEWLHAGAIETIVPAFEGSIAAAPPLPASLDAGVTATWIAAVRAGAIPMPSAITAQIAAVRRVMAAPNFSKQVAA